MNGSGHPLSRNRGAAQGGFTVLEALLGGMVLVVAILAAARTTVGGIDLEKANLESTIALQAAREKLEQLRGENFRQVFARYNAYAGDDPAGAGTAPGATFTVPRLRTPGSSTPAVGRISFPASTASPGVLDETLPAPFFGVATDLDLNGVATDTNVSATYKILPCRVRISWQGVTGARSVELSTVLCE